MPVQPPRPNLYQLSDEIRAVLAQTDENGELTPEQWEQLDKLTVGVDAKFDAYCTIIAELKTLAAVKTAYRDGHKAEMDRLGKAVKAIDNNVERMKERMKTALTLLGQDRHETKLFRVRLQNNKRTLECTAALKDLDPKFLRVETSVDASAADDVYRQTGEAPAGFRVKEQTCHVRIE